MITKSSVFLKNNPNIMVTKADKGGSFVIIDKAEYSYIKKVECCLNDEKMYGKIIFDPLKMLEDKTDKLVKSINISYLFGVDNNKNILRNKKKGICQDVPDW